MSMEPRSHSALIHAKVVSHQKTIGSGRDENWKLCRVLRRTVGSHLFRQSDRCFFHDGGVHQVLHGRTGGWASHATSRSLHHLGCSEPAASDGNRRHRASSSVSAHPRIVTAGRSSRSDLRPQDARQVRPQDVRRYTCHFRHGRDFIVVYPTFAPLPPVHRDPRYTDHLGQAFLAQWRFVAFSELGEGSDRLP